MDKALNTSVASTCQASQKVIIIGAGIGGLATANLLAKAGYQVEVYEKSPAPGGRTGQLRNDGFIFDTGPSWLLMKDVFEHYYSLLDTSLDSEMELVRLDPAYKVFFESQPPVTITSDLQRDAATFEAIEKGSGKKLIRYVKRSTTTYDLSLKHFLYTNFTRPGNLIHPDIAKNMGRLAALLLRKIHGYVSSSFKDSRLQKILEYQMVFLGVSPYQAPALYNLMSSLDFQEGVYYPQGGLYSLTQSMFARGISLGVSYFFNADVAQITSVDGQATGVTLSSGDHKAADIVVSNADLWFTETHLLDDKDRSYPASYWQQKQPSASALLLYLGVRGELPEFQHHNLLFVDDWKSNFDAIAQGTMPEKASIYICKSSQTDPTVAPAGHENVFVLVPIPAGLELDEISQNKWSDHYLEQIRLMTGVDLAGRAISRTVYGPGYFGDTLHSWQNSMLGPAHVLSQSAMFRTANQSRTLSNLYYVGAGTRPGIGLPMCLISAELVYKQLAGDQSAGPVTSVENLIARGGSQI